MDQVKALYRLFIDADCTMVEVNPLAEDDQGALCPDTQRLRRVVWRAAAAVPVLRLDSLFEPCVRDNMHICMPCDPLQDPSPVMPI